MERDFISYHLIQVLHDEYKYYIDNMIILLIFYFQNLPHENITDVVAMSDSVKDSKMALLLILVHSLLEIRTAEAFCIEK